jgi:hypothetical protein
VVVAASLLTTAFVVASAILLWRQERQHRHAVVALHAAAESRDQAGLDLRQELQRLRRWAADTLESLPQPPAPELAHEDAAATPAVPTTWTTPSLFHVTDVEPQSATPRRSRYLAHLSRLYGAPLLDEAVMCQYNHGWSGSAAALRVAPQPEFDPFAVYVVAGLRGDMVRLFMDAAAAGRDHYRCQWYPHDDVLELEELPAPGSAYPLVSEHFDVRHG